VRKRSRTRGRFVEYFPSVAAHIDINPDVHMFAQDVALGVMPIGDWTRRHENFAVIFNGDEVECQRAKEVLGTISSHRRYDPEELVSDVVNTTAQHLAWQGVAAFEIISNTENGAIELYSFPTARLLRLPWFCLQFVPLKDWSAVGRRIVIGASKNIWYVTMPVSLGGKPSYRQLLARLSKGERLGPKFWQDDLRRGELDKDFDFQKYARDAAIYLGKATRSWGWNGRDWTEQWWTEYFGVYRRINFYLAQAFLREHIISELNRLMVRLQIRCSVNVTGLPKPTEIMEVSRSLQEGLISFTEALDRVSI